MDKSITLTEEEYETVIKMFGVFIMGKVMEAYKNKENITIIIDDEFENYKQKYLKNGSSTN